jgi:hypothetical protein
MVEVAYWAIIETRKFPISHFAYTESVVKGLSESFKATQTLFIFIECRIKKLTKFDQEKSFLDALKSAVL